ncbi:TIGR01213 family protein [Oesophagostomum dentatum]|uniref:tRNA pseudouridine(55) synthase n=1 Tax=Oesophagostomum dentatum TaxID=61180 RepID=A0A0B1TBK0_OESDE|nr:TIGR01213 family protein [Oesophagostomum dentatum]
MSTSASEDNQPILRLCALCCRQIAGEAAHVETVAKSYECVLCFGLLDQDYIEQVAQAVGAKLKESPYDAAAFTLALNLPISQVLRETIIKRSRPDLNGILVSVPYKIRNIDAYLPKLRQASGLRAALATDLQLTVTFETDEFTEYDTKFLTGHFPNDFQQSRKRKFYDQSDAQPCTKIKVEQVLSRIKEDIAKKYELSSPSRFCTFSIAFERDPVFITGRYCKFSRSLPQSPWSIEDKAAPKCPGHSVSEKVCELMKAKFGASDARFVASGREDLDVRMLGDGRPFTVELRNCHFTVPLSGTRYLETLRALESEINRSHPDIQVKYLTRITREEAELISVGEEDKRKRYVAYCYSTLPLSEEALVSATKQAPVQVMQKTPVRVLKRRSLLERPRTVHSMDMLPVDTHHFLLRLETQAGTYVKEFVHGDFGRTRPSLADLLGVANGEVDILDLDVDKVDFEWPPLKVSPTVFR